jgi:hypothetical protein
MKSFFQNRKVKTAKKIAWQVTYCVGTAAAMAAVLYWSIPVWAVVALVVPLLAHEFAHYFQALRLKMDPSLPLFFPVPLPGFLGGGALAFGATRVRGFDPEREAVIALTGPMIGVIVALAFLVGFAIAGFVPGVWFSLWMTIFHFVSGTIGSDGRRYRRAKQNATFQEDTIKTAYATV